MAVEGCVEGLWAAFGTLLFPQGSTKPVCIAYALVGACHKCTERWLVMVGGAVKQPTTSNRTVLCPVGQGMVRQVPGQMSRVWAVRTIVAHH